jgi:hypothetical protein
MAESIGNREKTRGRRDGYHAAPVFYGSTVKSPEWVCEFIGWPENPQFAILEGNLPVLASLIITFRLSQSQILGRSDYFFSFFLK